MSKKRKDMSWKQFQSACERRGIRAKEDAFLGYCKMNSHNHGQISVSRLNGGSTLRQQLAYLIKEQSKIDRDHKEKGWI
jgi:hypothetical protein